MCAEKQEVQFLPQNFMLDELESMRDSLQSLTLLWTPEIEELLSQLSKGIVPLSGISAAKKCLDEIRNVDLPDDKKSFLFDNLKEIPISDLLRMFSDYLESHGKEDVVISQTAPDMKPEISKGEWPDPVETVSYTPRMRETTINAPAKYYPIDDEEYMVRSKYVHPSPTGVEEGYPPLVKKKKEAAMDY